MTPVTYLLLGINIVVFGLQLQDPQSLLPGYALWPLGGGFAPWQIITCAFLHGSVGHLAANMFGLWMFGRDVEREIGSARFVNLYMASVVTASLAQLLVTSAAAEAQPTVGASGGLFGVLGAFALLFPSRRVMLIFFPVPLPAPVFVTLYALFELYTGVTGTINGVAHFAHLGGLVGGLALAWYWKARRT